MDWHILVLMLLIAAGTIAGTLCCRRVCLGPDEGSLAWLAAAMAFVILVIHLLMDH